MIVVTTPTAPISDVGILLGRQGENKARQIVFDLAWLIEEYGNGTAVLVHQRSKDSAPYICTTTQTGSNLTWTLNNLDTAYDGWGQAELRWTVSDVLAKTLVYKTMVVRSITADSEIPDAYQSWYDEMIDYIDEHCASPEQIAAAVEEYLEEHPISAPVQSVNNKTGDVTLTASDVGAGTYSKPSGGIPKTDLASGVQSSLDKADSALQSYTETDPTVPSWAKQQNKPTYTAQEVGALPSDTTIPTKVSQLQNDSGFGTYSKPSGGIPKTDLASAVQTSLGKADSALQTAPVISVNTKTGAVTLAAGDIGYDDSATYDNGTVGKGLTDLKGGLSDISEAILNVFQHVAYKDTDGETAYQTLHDLVYPPATLVSISAVYTQSGTVYTTDSLDSLKSDLVVTAHFDDSSSDTVTTYTLSGTLTVGTSTITVSYGGKTTTFNVTVSAVPVITSISAVFTPMIVYAWDTLDILKPNLTVKAIYSDSSESTISSSDYTLSGTLADGNSTITVSYDTFTTTFTVPVNGVIYTKGYVSDQTNTSPKTAALSTNANRILGNSSVGSTPLKMKSDGSASSCHPIPIRAGYSQVVTEIDGNRRVCIVLEWDSELNDYKQVYSSGWQASTNIFYINEAYRDGTHFMDFNVSGPTGSEDMSNVDTSEWSIIIRSAS